MKTLAVLLAVLVALPVPAGAYLHFATEVGGQSVALKWEQTPVRWFATDRGVPGVSATQFQTAVNRAFQTWQSVRTASIDFEFVGFTRAEPFEDDGVTVLGFQNEPDMDRTLGATGFLIDVITGEILEADVFFNSTFDWSTAAAGEPGSVDLESIALHEIGHVLGLGHSGLGETELLAEGGRRVVGTGAVMFPIAFARGSVLGRDLQPDDIAGVSDLYPDGDFRDKTGIAQGRVVRSSGAGIFGAHVIAFNPRTGALIAGFAVNDDGEFRIAGLEPGGHVIRVEPLDDVDVDSIFSDTRVDANFRVTFYDRLFAAPAGGAGELITISVQPK